MPDPHNGNISCLFENIHYKNNGNGTFLSPTGVFQGYFITASTIFINFIN